MMTRLRLVLALCSLGMAPCGTADAHKPSDSYLTLTRDGGAIDGRWDIALRDLDHAIGLDANRDGAITWGETRARHDEIAAYALARLTIETDGTACGLRPTAHLIDEHSDGAYAVLRFAGECAQTEGVLRVAYRLFFDLDPQHRGLVQLQIGEAVASTVLSPDRPAWQTEAHPVSLWSQVPTYFREGIHHILFGFDHLLFLLALLLPAVLRGGNGGWRPIERFGEAAGDVVKVVTAFTLAHSLTLGLAAFGWIDLPPRIVEPLIAVSIIFAAINNIHPMVTRRLWAVAFLFGLVHGIGFAGALRDLGLPRDALLLPLVSFNLGVEAGQLALVALFLPIAYGLRRTSAYQTVGVRFGSLVIVATASLWLIERAFRVAPLV